MIFIGGISSGMKQIEYLKTVICSRCGSYGRYQVYMTYMYFSFFFIPLFKWNRRYFVKLSCCGTVYALDYEVGTRLRRGEAVEIEESDLTICEEGSGVRRSGDAPEDDKQPLIQDLKRCPDCGYGTGEDFSYCPKCGSRLNEGNDTKF